VDAGDGGAAEVNGNGAGLMIDGAADFFTGCHLHDLYKGAFGKFIFE
jgi:hypothetical protein